LYKNYELSIAMVKLKDIAEIQTGIYAKPSPNPDTVYLQVNDFDSNGVICNTAKPSIAISEKNAGHYLNIGDLLFAAKGTKNFCTIFPESDNKCVASSSFLVVRIIKENIVKIEYINWYLNLSSTIDLLGANAVGTAIPSITKATLEGIEIPLPSISTQKQIVEIAELQKKERQLLELIIVKHQQITDYKLKNIISNEK
jgi:restriction endonuclease S subunit